MGQGSGEELRARNRSTVVARSERRATASAAWPTAAIFLALTNALLLVSACGSGEPDARNPGTETSASQSQTASPSAGLSRDGSATDPGETSAAGRSSGSETGAASIAAPVAPHSRFIDITESAGIDFVHFNDASDHRLLPETMGSGAAFFDYDRDGRPDLYLVNGAPLTSLEKRARGGAERSTTTPTGALYRNLGGGRFEDVTTQSGLAVSFFGMGAAVGDYDNDGWTDLVVTALGRDHVFRNRGDGTFEDVTVRLGLGSTGFTTSAAFVDYDRDGWIDLFLCRYVDWSPETDIECRPDGVHRIYCTPESYRPISNLLFRNVDGRSFVDVTKVSGIGASLGKGLGVVPFDHDGDGWPDLLVANDTVRNFLFRNNGDGTFGEIGAEVGIAYSESGAPRGGMGVDSGDLDGDGRPDVVVTNFTHEMVALFRATGRGTYLDDAAHLGLGFPTLLTLGFGVLAEDLDGDGFLDLVIANGHIEPGIADIQRGQTYAQLPQIFVGDAAGLLSPLAASGAIDTPLVGRGLSSADIDGDGDLDLLFTQNGGAARLFRNDSPAHHWIRIHLVGAGVADSGQRREAADPLAEWGPSSASAYGARVTLWAGGRSFAREMVSGRSYLSANDPGLTFGIGSLSHVDSLTIGWPSGAVERIIDPGVDRVLTIREASDLGRLESR